MCSKGKIKHITNSRIENAFITKTKIYRQKCLHRRNIKPSRGIDTNIANIIADVERAELLTIHHGDLTDTQQNANHTLTCKEAATYYDDFSELIPISERLMRFRRFLEKSKVPLEELEIFHGNKDTVEG